MPDAQNNVKNGIQAAQGNGRDNVPFANDKNLPMTITTAAVAGGSTISLVTFTVKDGAGNALTRPFIFDLYLSDAADGEGLTATTASGAVAAGASGTVFDTMVAKKAFTVQTNDQGVFILSITDSAKTGFYPVAVNPYTGECLVGTQLVTASYGA
jgi:hypothetical protein